MQIEYNENSINEELLFSFLKYTDDEFTPSLSSRVNLENYAKKMCDNAYLFEAFYNNELIALVAMYANDIISKKAYITYVYCKKEYRKLGIANQLIKNAFKKLEEINFKSCSLEVSVDNIPAINLYSKFNFIVTKKQQEKSLKTIMQAVLGGGGYLSGFITDFFLFCYLCTRNIFPCARSAVK